MPTIKAVDWRFAMLGCVVACVLSQGAWATGKPMLHGKHWIAITGKPLAATAGA